MQDKTTKALLVFESWYARLAGQARCYDELAARYLL